jgi:putative MFS transporter
MSWLLFFPPESINTKVIKMSPIVNAAARLDRLPFSRFHVRLLLLIGSGMLLDTFDINLTGGVLGALDKSGWSDLHHNAMFISATFAGMMLGGWFAGVLGDRYGRRFSYQFNLLLFGFASLAAAVAPSIDWLIAARFVTGLGLGAEVVVGYATFNEFLPPASRGRWAGVLGAIGSSALFISSVAGLIIIPTLGWRWMFVPVGIGALIVWYLRKSMPESPRWLEMKGRFREAEEALTKIEAEAGIPDGSIIVDSQPAPSVDQSSAALFRGDLLTRTIVGCALMIGLNTVIYGLITWLPSFFVHQGLSINRSLVYNMLMTFGGPVGTIIGLVLSDAWGRKPTLITFSLAVAVVGMIYSQMTTPVAIAALGFTLVAMTYVNAVITWSIYVPELFPTELRLRGTGLCNTVGRLASIFIPYLVVSTFNKAGVEGVIAVVLAIQLIAVLILAFFGIETRKRSLEVLVPKSARS